MIQMRTERQLKSLDLLLGHKAQDISYFISTRQGVSIKTDTPFTIPSESEEQNVL